LKVFFIKNSIPINKEEYKGSLEVVLSKPKTLLGSRENKKLKCSSVI
jgi:hypothetical protein